MAEYYSIVYTYRIFFTELKTFDPQIYTTVKWNFWTRLAFLEHIQCNKMQVNEDFVF